MALLIHGYHPYAEDAEIYLPGVLKILNPALFPANAEFFGAHANYSLYPELVVASVRVTHLALPWVAFLWQLSSIFLLLVGSWRLASVLFEQERARWAAVALMATLLTLPIAGTALYVLDQYLNPRNLAAFMAVFAVAEVLRRKYLAAVAWLAMAAAVHPLMSSFAIAFCVWLAALDRYRPRVLGLVALLPFGLFDPAPPAYHEVALRQSYFFVLRWEWYEWLGLIGPLLLFWWLARFARRDGMEKIELVSRAMIPLHPGGDGRSGSAFDPRSIRSLGAVRAFTVSGSRIHVADRYRRRIAGPVRTSRSGLALGCVVRSHQRGHVHCPATDFSGERACRVALGADA